jgi:hypothetical protein
MPSRRHIRFLFVAVFVFVSFALISMAKAQNNSPMSDQKQIVRAVNTVFAAVRADDSQELDSVVTPDFYIFDGGVRLNVDSLITLIKAQHAAANDTMDTSPASTSDEMSTASISLFLEGARRVRRLRSCNRLQILSHGSNEGGASSASVPQCLSGVALSSNSSVPPCSTKFSGSQVFVVLSPFTFRLCT